MIKLHRLFAFSNHVDNFFLIFYDFSMFLWRKSDFFKSHPMELNFHYSINKYRRPYPYIPFHYKGSFWILI